MAITYVIRLIHDYAVTHNRLKFHIHTHKKKKNEKDNYMKMVQVKRLLVIQN